MKQVQDPIYGYIDIEDDYIPLIDSAEFQRLRNIRQTGYSSLYPSALHNRFVHSLGVFYLGKKAFQNFRKNTEHKTFNEKSEDVCTACVYDEQYIGMLEKTFSLACLLHDIGHSPFSHTGENFYGQSTDFPELIFELIQSDLLRTDMINKGFGKPHEAMSVIVGLRLLRDMEYVPEFDKELFARCIMGTVYSVSENDKVITKLGDNPVRINENIYKNTIIGMLNGKIIDVDKMDYLRRDAYVTGYSSMAIDYDRILAGYTISTMTYSDGKSEKVSAFRKKSLSVIENIAQANDLERRWVQSNPVILYDNRLIEMTIIKFNDYMMKNEKIKEKYKNIFNCTALSKDGFPREDEIDLCLLSDDDIICYLKNSRDPKIEEIKKQYFNRNQRYKPLWKNEAEFDSLVSKGISSDSLANISTTIRDVVGYPINLFFLNSEERDRVNKLSENAKDKAIKLLDLFERFSTSHNLDFKFAIIKGTTFESNYSKFESGGGYVEIDEGKAIKLKDTLAVKAKLDEDDKSKWLFHVYTIVSNINKAGGRENLRKELTNFINKNWELGQ